MKAVRPIEAFVSEAPNDSFFRNRLFQHAVHSKMPLFGSSRRERPWRTHERLRCERPNLIAGRSHLLKEMVDPPLRTMERPRPHLMELDGHARSFAYRSAATPTAPESRINNGVPIFV